VSSDHGSVASSPGVSRIAVLTLWFALLAGFIEAAWRAIERYELSIRAGPELGPVSMISNGLHYIVTGQDSIELYHYINDLSEMSSLHESPSTGRFWPGSAAWPATVSTSRAGPAPTPGPGR